MESIKFSPTLLNFLFFYFFSCFSCFLLLLLLLLIFFNFPSSSSSFLSSFLLFLPLSICSMYQAVPGLVVFALLDEKHDPDRPSKSVLDSFSGLYTHLQNDAMWRVAGLRGFSFHSDLYFRP